VSAIHHWLAEGNIVNRTAAPVEEDADGFDWDDVDDGVEGAEAEL